MWYYDTKKSAYAPFSVSFDDNSNPVPELYTVAISKKRQNGTYYIIGAQGCKITGENKKGNI